MANPYNPSLMPRTYFRAPRVPFDFRAVLFAALGYLVWWAGDAALSGIFDKQSVSSAFLVWLYRLFEGIPYLGGGLRLALSGVFHMDVGNAMTGGYTFWHELVGGLWFVGVWSFVTLGVARIVALRIARDEGLSIGETIRFSLKNWTSLLFVPLIIGGLIIFEFLPAPFPVSPPDTPAWYATLAQDPAPGVVFNLPANFERPGYLLYQITHGKPITTGYVTRDDPKTLLPESLATFDAVVMNNIHEPNPFVPEDIGALSKDEQKAAWERDAVVKMSLLEFVSRGKGIVGIHAATAALQGWQEYGEMMGGFYGGHMTTEATMKNEEPDHSVNACFEGKPFAIFEEFYIMKAPYAREKLRVLLSLDLAKTQDPKKRKDNDYAISWVKPYGKGRVFYTTMGHMPKTYWNPTFLRHLLAAIQFATGDLKAPVEPRETK